MIRRKLKVIRAKRSGPTINMILDALEYAIDGTEDRVIMGHNGRWTRELLKLLVRWAGVLDMACEAGDGHWVKVRKVTFVGKSATVWTVGSNYYVDHRVGERLNEGF